MNKVENDIRKVFESSTTESYSRFDDSHSFDIYLGSDTKGRKSLAIILDAEREKISSSTTISIEYFKRSDGKVMLCFGLEDDSLTELFCKFCEDIIESTRDGKPEDGFSPIVERWNTWVRFFTKTAPPLSESEIVGLIGEILFLQNEMIERYGIDQALEAFIGVDKAHKDFEIDNTWYEVKTIHNGAKSIKISSLEQLESNKAGSLEVVTLDQGTLGTKDSITLNSVVTNFKEKLSRKQTLEFDDKMRRANYMFDERYDDFIFILVRIDQYTVKDGFPKIMRTNLPSGISKVSYEIDLSSIENYRITE
jgi:hypothetical protein